jgi:hypothetical protein
MNKFGLTMLALGFCMAGGAAHAACPADLAVYSHMERGDVSASLSKMQSPKSWSDIQFSINTPSKSYDYEFTASNGYSMQYLVPLPEVAEDDESEGLSVTFFDEKLKVLELPQSGQPAPAYIFAPKVGAVIYYGSETQEFVPIGMWKLSGCAE